MNKFLCGFLKVTGVLPFKLLCRPKYYYEDKRVQSRKIKGAAIVMPNHHSIYDFAIILFAFPGRNLRCLVSEAVYNQNKGLAGFMDGLGSIKVERDQGDFTFIDKSCGVLQDGGVVEIYPEARIPQKGEEKPLEFKHSVSIIALESGCPIIPVVTNGKFLKKERLRVLIGKPIDVNALVNTDGMDEKEKIEVITKALRQRIIELRDELERKTKEKIK